MSSINQASRRDFIAGAAALAGAGVAGAAVAAGIPQTAVATETTPEPAAHRRDLRLRCRGLRLRHRRPVRRMAGRRTRRQGSSWWRPTARRVSVATPASSKVCRAAAAPMPTAFLTLNEGPDIFDYGFTVISDYCHCACDLRLLRKFVTWMNPMLDWTHNVQGIDFLGLDIPLNNTMMAPPISYKPNEDHTIGGGRMAIYTMYEGCKNLGVEFLFDSRAIDLVMKDGAAGRRGLRAPGRQPHAGQRQSGHVRHGRLLGQRRDGREVHPRQLRVTHPLRHLRQPGGRRYQHGPLLPWEPPCTTPRHLMFCSPVLAGPHSTRAHWSSVAATRPDTDRSFNEKGERFCNEECIKDWAEPGNTGALQKHIFTVIDQDFVEKIHTEGPVTKRTNDFKANEPVPDFQEEIDGGLAAREPPRREGRHPGGAVAEKLGTKATPRPW